MTFFSKKRYYISFYFIIFGLLPKLAISQIKTLPVLWEKYNIPVKDGEIVYEIIDSTYPGKTV